VQGNAVPIVVVTGDQSAREKARAIGAVGHLGKPFDLDELTQLLERALAGG
jgi:CheY-like chemotaxis protein